MRACLMPMSDPIKVPDHLSDETVLFLSDIFPTGYMAAENVQISPGDTVPIWGAGPVGLFAAKSAFLLGAETRYRHRKHPRTHQSGEAKSKL